MNKLICLREKKVVSRCRIDDRVPFIPKRKIRRSGQKTGSLERTCLVGLMLLLQGLNKTGPNYLKNYLRMSKPDIDRLMGNCFTN